MINIKKSKHVIRVFIIICINLICSRNAKAQYLIQQSVFGNGGAALSGSGYSITGTLGQTVIGIISDSSNDIYSGFLYQENSIITGAKNNLQNSLPQDYSLAQNYPNPFNPSTIINFTVPKTSLVTIKVYNVLGKEIATLINEEKSAGNYSIQFSTSGGYASGVYFYSMQAGNFVQTKKLLLLK